MRQDDPVDFLYYIESGICIGSYIDVSGNEYMLDAIPLNKGIASVAGLGLCLLDSTKSPVNHFALSDVICYQIPAAAIKTYLLEHPEDLMAFTTKLMGLYINTYERLFSRHATHTIERYCKFLLDNSNLYDGSLLLDKNFTNVEISQLIGIHPVTLSRMQSALINEGCVKKTARGLEILDKSLLSDIADRLVILEYRKTKK